MARYIALEGIDGSGKSEVAKRLSQMMPNSVTTKEPTDRLAKVIMENTSTMGDALLFAADRAIAMEDVKGWMGEGKSVITDRTFYSNMAYQGAALKEHFGGLDKAFQWIHQCNQPFLIEPDIVLLLDLPVETALGRVNNRGKKTRFEMHDYLETVRDAYLKLAEKHSFEIIDATKTLEEVVRQCAEKIGI